MNVETFEFRVPARLLDLLQRVSETPNRELVSVELQARARPRWEGVSVSFLRWRAAQGARRAAEMRGPRR